MNILTRLSRTRLSRHPPISSPFRVSTPIYICYFKNGYLVTRLSRHFKLGPSTDEISGYDYIADAQFNINFKDIAYTYSFLKMYALQKRYKSRNKISYYYFIGCVSFLCLPDLYGSYMLGKLATDLFQFLTRCWILVTLKYWF